MPMINELDEHVISVQHARTMDVFHFGASQKSGLRFLGWVPGDDDRRRPTVDPYDLEAARVVADGEAREHNWL